MNEIFFSIDRKQDAEGVDDNDKVRGQGNVGFCGRLPQTESLVS